MSYGLQISASGATAALYRQDVHANNLANMDSVGFKPDIPTQHARDAVRIEDSLPFLPSDQLLERLGGGVLMNPNLVDFAQGAIRTTGNPLDLAIDGEGFFVMRPQPGSDPKQVQLTRDGRFTRSSTGQLVSASTGAPVLDTGDRPITIAPGAPVTVDGDGTVRQRGATVARLKVVAVSDLRRLEKLGAGMFSAPTDALARAGAGTGSIKQSTVEESGVSEIRSLMSITAAGRDVEGNISMIQQHDRLMDRAINSLGRVA